MSYCLTPTAVCNASGWVSSQGSGAAATKKGQGTHHAPRRHAIASGNIRRKYTAQTPALVHKNHVMICFARLFSYTSPGPRLESTNNTRTSTTSASLSGRFSHQQLKNQPLSPDRCAGRARIAPARAWFFLFRVSGRLRSRCVPASQQVGTARGHHRTPAALLPFPSASECGML